ncbi:MAG: EF-P lysine aminoacylase EpmA [Pseudomonadales bacterium]|nr:EF-P lysine aminoacylase EpmA [Pseudomonadales bacterium]MDP7144041.1 EF-P lysine aminoacylase EpmA [Pseudomonadales bacterium]MDP7595552.1 EF-P lysine aminoacylase EpmA [Pseudomonadales bacterium]HJN50919.1 EF-P lysine aminoacylase EpmA [Pseudomonadales bacterium]
MSDKSEPISWQPAANMEMIQSRAALLARIRNFFAARQVIEVETPLLGSSSATDPHLESCLVSGERDRYLQTSPEFAMKRMLAADATAIYQICKAFRAGESGKRHNIEFTILEWYRPGFDLAQLMDEVEELVELCIGQGGISRVAYATAFHEKTGLNPHTAELDALLDLAEAEIGVAREVLVTATDLVTRSTCLDLIASHLVEAELSAPTFLYDYPACQCALARIVDDSQGHRVARRFELFVNSMELANGYLELVDAAELRHRFESDNRQRQLLGTRTVPVDEQLLDAMAHGLPDCAGVAVGVDRLLMVMSGSTTIQEVLAFPSERA